MAIKPQRTQPARAETGSAASGHSVWIRPRNGRSVIRNLGIIGEATKKLPQELRARQSQVEWKKMTGLRNILIHEYWHRPGDHLGYHQKQAPNLRERGQTIALGEEFIRVSSQCFSGNQVD
ncbi:DUF86 domain-containing protein [Acidobacteria bacterium AH-259-O06]|nr:DUF86 domain-containing protein [Acidobacteria bacterium AH-259-O06]